MKNSVKLAALAVSSFLAASVFAQQSPEAVPGNAGYVTNSSNLIWVNSTGLCWRTSAWTPANAQKGCDEDLMPKQAPAPVAPPPPPAAPAPAPKAVAPAPAPKAVAPVSEKVTFAADAFFDFDKAVVKPEGKAKLDDLVSKLKGVALEVIIAVGHTDSIGTVKYNLKLSVRRAEAVKAYLVSKGIEPNRIYTEGKGKSQPVASNKTASGRAKNRRVEIEVVGTRQRK
jgi:OmpA-OmpF porin, OOP family